MFRRWNQKKGAVLIVCLGILAVLTLLGISFSQLMIVERSASSNYSDGVRAKFAAQSGIEYATAYLRKLARIKQHSDMGTPGDPTNPGDGWYFDPFWTDEQGRPLFDINPDPTVATILEHPPAFRLGTILDGNSSDLYSESYTGCVHGTYYEQPSPPPPATPTTPGYPGNYFQVKIQSCASQFYLNTHPAHMIGLENMLTSFIRACLSSARTHQIPQPDGSVLPGRAFFDGFSVSPGDYEGSAGAVRLFVRSILQARLGLPGGVFSTKEQLLQVLQDLQNGTLPLLAPWPSGTLGPEEIYNDLKNFVTCQAWVDDSVLYLNPESSPGTYAGSIPNTLNSFPGSTGSTGTARNPAPVSLGTIGGTGPYYNFTPSAIETYYSCRELSLGGALPPTGTGIPVTGRAPIDVNTAPKEVLTAVFANLTAGRPDLFSGESYFADTARSEISFIKAEALAKLLVDSRNGVAANSKYNDYFRTFYTWDQFYGFLNTFDSGTGTSPLQLTQEQSDIIKAMANPNTDVNKFNPDTTLRKRVDKGDIGRFKLLPGNLPSFTTELCFGSMGYYDITSVGKILGTAGFTPGPASRVALAAKSEFNSIVRVYEVYRDTTQRDFETDRDHLLGRNADTPPDPVPSSSSDPVEVIEYPIISFPEPRDNTNINDPGTTPSDEPMRPRSVDDATNTSHAPGTYSGNVVHAAEYDGQLSLNGMVATEFYQSADPSSPSSAGYSNAQWQPYVVTATDAVKDRPFPYLIKAEFVFVPDPTGATGGSYEPVVTPPEYESPPGSGEIDYSIGAKGKFDESGFLNFAGEGFRSLVVGFNYNSWEPNAPIPECSGSFASVDPARFDDFRADYLLSELVGPPGATASKTMREGRNLYPLGFNPRAHYASSGESNGNTYPLSSVNGLSEDSTSRRRTYLRYHNANVHRFEGGVSVWVKPDHDFTIDYKHALHQGTIVAFRNGDRNPGGTVPASISYYDPPGGGGLNNASASPDAVHSNTKPGAGYFSDDFISNAFLIRFDSAYSIRAAIWGNNHFEGEGFEFVDGTGGSAPADTIGGSGARIRSTPQVWSTNYVGSTADLSGSGIQDGIRCMPGKWQTIQIWYRRSPPYLAGGGLLKPFMPLASQGAVSDFAAGSGYRFVWSLPIQDELTNIVAASTTPIQPGVSSWPSGAPTHPTWGSGGGPFVGTTTEPEINGSNPCYRYCTTVWKDTFRATTSSPEGPVVDFYGDKFYPFGSPGSSDPDRQHNASSIFGAFMSSAASMKTEKSATGMDAPLSAGSPGPDPGSNPAGATIVTVDYDGIWFGEAHPDWFDGRFGRTSYTNANDDNLFDLALGGGTQASSSTPTDEEVGISSWDAPGSFPSSDRVGNLAFATIDNFQVHPADFSFSKAVRDSNVGDTSGVDETYIETTHLGKPVEDTGTLPFNDMQKRYWDAGHRYGEHSTTSHFFSTAKFQASGGEIVHGTFKKYCRKIAQDALKYGNITIGTAAFTTYSGNVETPSAWSDSASHPYDPFLARKNISETGSGVYTAYSTVDNRRLEYVSYLGNSGKVNKAAGYSAGIIPKIPYNVSVRVWKDAPKTSETAIYCCDKEYDSLGPAEPAFAVKAEPEGSGGSSSTLANLATPTEYVRRVTLSQAEAATTFISYSAGFCSETLHAVANETPFLDDVTISYLLPASVVLQYREVID